MQSRSLLSARFAGLLSLVGLCLMAQAAPAPQSAFLEQVKAHFAEWDADHDASLTSNEIELALANPDIKGPQAAAVAALRRGMVGKGIKALTLEQIAASVPYDAKKTPAPPKYNLLYGAALKRMDVNHDLFPEDQPKLDTIAQGHLGDCFLMAAMGTFVSKKPEELKKMMQVQPDGKVAVTFATGRKVVLPPPTDGELAVGATSRDHGTWPNMMEIAVGQVFLDNQKKPTRVAPYSIIGTGGSPHTVLQMLTGNKMVRVGCEDFRKPGLDPAKKEEMLKDLRATLIKAQDAGKLIVCGNGAIGKQAIVPGIYYLHSYSVLGYDPKTDMVNFWNPMSNAYKPKGAPGLKTGYSTSYGKFSVPLPEVVEWLGSFSIETDQPMDKVAQ